MTTWYYAVGEDRKGPVDDDEIRSLIKSGQIIKQTYIWRDGMDEWQLAGEHPDLLAIFVTPPPLPADPMAPKLPRPAFQPSIAKPGTTLTSRPWPRFWARFIDNLIFLPLMGFGVGLLAALYAPDFYMTLVGMNEYLFTFMIFPLVAVVLALSMTLVGNTPGKAIVGVQVPAPSGSGRFGFYLAREFKVWVAGLGLGIPLIALFTQVSQYRRLSDGRPASYDEGNPLVIANPAQMRLVIAIVLGLALLVGNLILRTADEEAMSNLSATQTWVNPVTGKSATMGKIWQSQPIDANSGSAFYFIATELLSEAIFGHETLPSDDIDTISYANAIKNAVASEVNISTDWLPVQVNGMSGLRAKGKSVQATDATVEVTVAVSGRNAWRTLMFTRGSSAEQMAEKDRFVNAMFETAE